MAISYITEYATWEGVSRQEVHCCVSPVAEMSENNSKNQQNTRQIQTKFQTDS